MRKNRRIRFDKYSILILFFIHHGFALGQQSEWIKYFHRGVEAHYIQISDNIFVSQIETRNFDYKRFLRSLKESGDMVKYYKSLPDSSGWINKVNYSFSTKYFDQYNSNPEFDEYPVVSVSFEAINWYCEWLTEIYKKEGKRYKSIVVRLPSENEWEKFANPHNYANLPWDSETAFRPCKKRNCEDSCLIANIKVKNLETENELIGMFGTGVIQCASVIPSKKSDFYDIIGNVSEMTSDGNLKGGSWDNYLSECYIHKTQSFEAPDPRVGFRIIIEILEQ